VFPVLLRGHRQGDKAKAQWRLTGLKGNLRGLFGWRLFALEVVSKGGGGVLCL
jgi:hypothetical protein